MITRTKENVQSRIIQKTVLCVLFIAAGLFLPMGFHRLGLGTAFLPMHIPVFIGAMVCGPWFGVIGALCIVTLSCVLTGMPPVFPVGVCMMVELAVYAGVSAGIMEHKRYSIPSLYMALVAGIAAGRIANGLANVAAAAFSGGHYSFSSFWEGTIAATLPGTILLLCVVPGIVYMIERVLKFHD